MAQQQRPLSIVGFEPLAPLSIVPQQEPQAEGNWLQQQIDKLVTAGRQRTPTSGREPSLGNLLVNPVTMGLLDTLNHPLDNAPTLGAMGAVAATGGMASPWALPIIAGGAGAAGAAVRGDQGWDIPKAGLQEGAMQAMGPVLGAMGKGTRGVAKTLAAKGMAPDAEVLGAIMAQRGAASPKEAYKIFRNEILDVAPGPMGSTDQLVNLKALIEEANQAKQLARQQVPTGTLAPRNANPLGSPEAEARLDTLYQAARQSEPGMTSSLDSAMQQRLNPDSVARDPLTGVPRRTPLGTLQTQPSATQHLPMNIDDALDMTKGISRDLATHYAAKQTGLATGNRQALDYDPKALEVLRKNWTEWVHGVAPDVAAADQRMSDLIPYRDAAEKANLRSAVAQDGPRAGVGTSMTGAPRPHRGHRWGRCNGPPCAPCRKPRPGLQHRGSDGPESGPPRRPPARELDTAGALRVESLQRR